MTKPKTTKPPSRRPAKFKIGDIVELNDLARKQMDREVTALDYAYAAVARVDIGGSIKLERHLHGCNQWNAADLRLWKAPKDDEL